MADFDLIPPSYKEQQSIRFMVRMFLIGCALIVVTTVTVNILLNHKIASVNQTLLEYEQKKAGLKAKQQYASNLKNIEQQLEQKQQAHLALMGQIRPSTIISIIDQSLPGQIWFEELTIGNQNPGGDESKRSQMLIRGKARNHSLIADFAHKLSGQDFIYSANIKRTTIDNESLSRMVNFILSVEVHHADNG